MKAGTTRSTAAAILVIALLVGCGDNGGDATTNVSTGEGTNRGTGAGTTESSKQAKASEGAHKSDSSGEGGAGGWESGAPKVSDPAPTPHRSLPNQGTEQVAPGVPTAKGGDNSIQEFGVEASSSERIEATRVIKDYLDARAAGDWARACARVSSGLREEFLHFSEASTQRGQPPSCKDALQSLTVDVPESALRTAADIRVLSMRAEGSSALLIYRNGENTPFSFPVSREGSEWKVAALDGSALVLGPDDFS
jgi:hypothetical protein